MAQGDAVTCMGRDCELAACDRRVTLRKEGERAGCRDGVRDAWRATPGACMLGVHGVRGWCMHVGGAQRATPGACMSREHGVRGWCVWVLYAWLIHPKLYKPTE
eukprot:365278-Chlamydomonas_euryale.AAC.11